MTGLTENRWFRARVRKEEHQGNFRTQDFQITVPVTGSHDRLMEAAIEGIRSLGYTVHSIKSHSINRSLL